MPVSFPTTIPLTPSPDIYPTRYGTVFVYHAIFAALAWALLAPVSHLIARVKPTTSFSVHRTAMLFAASLTAFTYLLGRFNATATPSQHSLLTNALMLAVVLQSTAGALRPRTGECPWRRAWATAHRAFGSVLLVFSFFVVAHSLSVFEVDGWLYVAIVAMLVMGACAVLVTLVSTLVSRCKGEKGPEDVDSVADTPLLQELDESGDSDV